MASVLGLSAAAVTAGGLPSSAFHARALVAVADMASPLSTILPRAAADASVSEPVLQRAAESLIAADLSVPPPDVLEQLAVTFGLGGAHATGRAARLAADLAQTVSAKPGDVPGSLEISAQAVEPTRAARIATAVAEALIADQGDMAAQLRRKRETDAVAFVERLKAEAVAARRRLAALGGVEADPAQIRTAAASQTANAQARVDVIRAIIASSSPPLSDRRDVPSAIETLQTTYLDLSRQLSKARETLGDRHTTIISLQEEVRHAAANLTAEWRRLAHLAETELSTARQREAMIRKADTAADATRRDAIDEARRGVQIADDTVVRAQTAQREVPADERSFHLMARAALPTVATGFSSLVRALIASVVGLMAFAVGVRLERWRLEQWRPAAPVSSRERPRDEAIVARAEPPAIPEARPAFVPRQVMKRSGKTMWSDRETAVEPDADLTQAMRDLLPSLGSIESSFDTVPMVMVAANEMAAGTMPVALALGREAVEIGYRVLLVEATRSRPELAAAADAEADPVLIDLFGVLRVALQAEGSDGVLYLAPSLEHGPRIASALARQGDTVLVDDLAAEFDLIVIDGGRATDSAAAGWAADAYVRVGRFASQRDDDHFAATFGVSTSALLGSIVASTFAPKVAAQPEGPMPAPRLGVPVRSISKAPPLSQAPRPSPVQARPAVPRRRVGLR